MYSRALSRFPSPSEVRPSPKRARASPIRSPASLLSVTESLRYRQGHCSFTQEVVRLAEISP